MARRRRHVDVQTEWDGGNYSNLSHARPHATTSGCGCLEGRFEPSGLIGRDGFEKVGEEI